jgi:hypothetical protein
MNNADVIRAQDIVNLAKERWDSENINVCDINVLCHPAHIEENVSEGDDNGAWVKAWLWVSFENTPFDKPEENED